MISNYRTDIIIDAGQYTKSIYSSILVDNEYYDGPDGIDITYDGSIKVTVTAKRLAHMRAGINSILRLAKAAHDTLQSSPTNNK
ncbi:MAG: hypothetical protein F4Y82_03140 [Cenarchaeum sp. SB0665_bin_23]|nr:hypothetical protein [Cenarchaeum sp. SB0665_bin_23]MYG33509.1 hypothetical protein [Cenarchaeum sp. SB0677_bin_16]